MDGAELPLSDNIRCSAHPPGLASIKDSYAQPHMFFRVFWPNALYSRSIFGMSLE